MMPVSTVTIYSVVVVLLVGRRTCDLQVTGLNPGWTPLCCGLGQATYTCVTKQYNLVLGKGGDLFSFTALHGE